MSSFFATFAFGQLLRRSLFRPLWPPSDCRGRARDIRCRQRHLRIGADACRVIFGRVIQAIGVSAASVLSRAIARDLFSGNELGRVLYIITVAMAAAPGFSPLLGGALDHVWGWRSAFAVVAAFGVFIGIAYAFCVGETHCGSREKTWFRGNFSGLRCACSRSAVHCASWERRNADWWPIRRFHNYACYSGRWARLLSHGLADVLCWDGIHCIRGRTCCAEIDATRRPRRGDEIRLDNCEH